VNVIDNVTHGSSSNDIDYGDLIETDRIHGSLYTRDDIFADELEKIFYSGWVFVGHASEIPKKNDYVRRTIGQEPVVMLRNKKGDINVLVNRCAHRGNMVCVHDRGSAKFLKCLYHGWIYSLDGELLDVPSPGGFPKDKSELRLRSLRTQSYQGFVFASFNENVISLEEHLGRATELLDRSAHMSPTGKIDLSAGWVRQKFSANWKMLPENDTDGYHVDFVHSSFAKVISSHYDSAILESEADLKSQTKDWGSGHTELYLSPSYERPLQWLGSAPDRFPEYTADMKSAYGEEKADNILMEGPPHSAIFPNLFLGEMNIVIIQPINANECVQWHTPMLLDGVSDEVNSKIIRQSEAAMGPSAFLLADDGIISERQQIALQGKSDWLDLSRGLERETIGDDGILAGHISDETTNRSFWHHYRDVMSAN